MGSSIPGPGGAGGTTVHVTFRPGWQSRRAQYAMVLDDVEVARRAVGERMTFGVPPGVHTLRVVVWRGGGRVREHSADLAFQALAGRQLTFACRMSYLRTTYGVHVEAADPTRTA